MKRYNIKGHNWDDIIFNIIAREAYASATRSTNANMHKLVVKLCTNWLPVSQRMAKYGNTTNNVAHVDNMNRTIMFSVADPRACGESLFFAHSTKEVAHGS
jgi:hypothetical protein